MSTCLIPIWDGPYRMRCSMGTAGVCHRHGAHQPHPDDGRSCEPMYDGYCRTHGVYMDPTANVKIEALRPVPHKREGSRVMELVEFLEARISEDEEVARAVGSPGSDGHWHAVEYDYEGLAVLDGPDEGEERYAERSAATAHITRWDPVRVLAECAAKRRLVELHRSAGAYLLGDVDGPRQAYCATCGSGEPYEYPTSWPCETLRLLAAPYAEHPDYPEATQ